MMIDFAKNLLKIRILRFLIGGGTSALVEFLTFIVFLQFLDSLFLSALLSFGCGFITSYLFNSLIVFPATGKRSRKKVGKQMIAFLMLGGFNAFASSFMVVLFAGYILDVYAKITAIIIIAIWNYIIMKNVIFKDHSE